MSYDKSSNGRAELLIRLLSVLVLTAGLATVIASAYIAVRSYSPVWFADEWQVPMDYQNLGGHYPLLKFWTQHNEHRIPIIKALQLLDLFWLKGDHRILMALSWFLQATLWIITTLFLRFLHKFNRNEMITLAGIGAFVFFNPNQMENFTWAFQLTFFGAFFFSTVALIALTIYGRQQKAALDNKTFWLFAAIALAFLSECSLASGCLTWCALLICAFLLRLKRPTVMVLLGCAFAAIGVYLVGYHSPGNFSNPLKSLHNLGQVVEFIAVYLGESWRFVAPSLGLVATVMAIALLVWFLVRHLGHLQTAEPLPAFALSVGLLIMATALITALGRQGEGLIQARVGRYQTPADLFWWSILLLLFTWATQRKENGSSYSYRIVLIQLTVLIAFAMEGRQFRTLLASNLYNAYSRDLAGLAFEAGVDDLPAIRSIYPIPSAVTPTYRFLLQRGLISPPFTEFTQMGIPISSHYSLLPPGTCIGATEPVHTVEANDGKRALSIGGWGYDPAANEGFSRVLAATPEGVIVGSGVGGGIRPDVVAAIPQVSDLNTGWQVYAMPNTPDSVKIYGVIRGTNQLCALSDEKNTSAEQKVVSPPAIAASFPPLDFISTTAVGSFDRLNGQPLAGSDEPQHAVHVRRENNLTVQGWMISADGAVAFDQVYVVDSGVRSVASLEARPDVAAHFQRQAILLCGFRFDIPPTTLSAGLHKLTMVGEKDGKFLKFAKVLYIYVE